MKGYVIMVIIWVLATILAAVAGFWMYQEVTKKQDTIKEQKDKIKEIRTQIAAKEDEYRGVSKVLGLVSSSSGFTDYDVALHFYERHEKALKVLGENYDEWRANEEDNKPTFENLARYMRLKINEYNEETATAKREYESEHEGLRTELDAHATSISRTLGELSDVHDALNAEIEGILTDIDSKKSKIIALTGDLDKLAEEGRRERIDFEETRKARTDKLEELKERYDMILKRAEKAGRADLADGKVIHADFNTGIVHINLNRGNFLRPGTQFDVFMLKKGEVRVDKGIIEVFKVGEEFSQARIIEQYDILDPITDEDLIANVLYDPTRVLHFAFAGNIIGKFSKEQLVRMIEEFGGVIDGETIARTDYLIIGEGYLETPNGLKAKALGVELLKYEELMELLGR